MEVKEPPALNPVVGIIIPAYNAAETIVRTLQAVAELKCTAQHISYYCVVVDDASSDTTKTLVDAFVKQGVVDCYTRNQENQGVSASRNVGIELCQHTDFISFCDADDQVIPLDNPEVDRLIKHRDADLIVFDHYVSESGQKKLISHQEYLQSYTQIPAKSLLAYLEKYLLRPNRYHLWTTCWSKLFSTKLIRENQITFSPEMKVFEDVKFNFQCLCHTGRIYYFSKPLYVHYRADAAQFKTSATMGGYCAVNESFAFDEALSVIPELLKRLQHPELPEKISHCLGAYAVITMIRSSLKIHSLKTLCSVRKQLIEVMSKPHFQQAFKDYDPLLAGGNPWIPRLLKHGMVTLAISIAYYQAIKRYASQRPKG